MALAFWTQKQDIGPSARTATAMAHDSAHGRVVLFGGDPGGPALADTWAWDGHLWTQAADTGPSARFGHTMAYDASHERVVLFGGAQGATLHHDTWAWDGSEWVQVADTGPSARSGAVMAFDLAASGLVLFGGSSGGLLFDDTWVWDGTEWTQVQDVGPSPRQGAAMAIDVTTSHPVLFGGAGADGAGLGDTWTWDGTAWTQAADTGPEARVGSGMAINGVNPGPGVLLFGGINSIDPALPAASRVVYSDTWRWSGGNWVKVQDIGPTARWGHGMTHRTADQRAVVFGGAVVFAAVQSAELGAAALRDTWERPFDGAGSPTEPGGGQPQPGQPVVDVASVDVMPQSVPIGGGTLDVTATLTGPAPTDLALVTGIFFDSGGGQYDPAQPPGFDIPPVTVPAGAAVAQFTITRNADPIQPGNYAIGVGVQGGQMQGGFFTVI